jgi:hypothetical protein
MNVELSMLLIGNQLYDGTSSPVPTGGSLVVQGSNQQGSNTITLVKAGNIVVDSVYIGQTSSGLTHNAGLISIDIDVLQCNNFYAGTKVYSGLDR